MNIKKIIVYEYEILFNILDEFKEKFSFDLINISKKNIEKILKIEASDYLIITRSEINGFKNQLIINEFPIKISQLLEKINLKFLKNRFNIQSDISISSYKLNLNSREISKNDRIVNLTEREINLILFLKKASSAVKIEELQKKVWEYGSELETHTVETHIYRLRKKIKDKFDDNNFIISSKKGYLIN